MKPMPPKKNKPLHVCKWRATQLNSDPTIMPTPSAAPVRDAQSSEDLRSLLSILWGCMMWTLSIFVRANKVVVTPCIIFLSYIHCYIILCFCLFHRDSHYSQVTFEHTKMMHNVILISWLFLIRANKVYFFFLFPLSLAFYAFVFHWCSLYSQVSVEALSNSGRLATIQEEITRWWK